MANMFHKNPKVIRNAGPIDSYPYFKNRKECLACGQPSKRVVEVRWTVFRGDDSVIALCESHRVTLKETEIIGLATKFDRGAINDLNGRRLKWLQENAGSWFNDCGDKGVGGVFTLARVDPKTNEFATFIDIRNLADAGLKWEEDIKQEQAELEGRPIP